MASEQGTRSTIELEGEWDVAQRDSACVAISQALERHPECLVLDLNSLTFIDSSGVHGLIDTCKRCAVQTPSLVIIPARPRGVRQRLAARFGITSSVAFEVTVNPRRSPNFARQPPPTAGPRV